MAQTDADLLSHLKEQLTFLRAHSATYDAGQRIFAKPLSAVLRILLHQTDTSHALLHELGCLDTMSFLTSGGECSTDPMPGTVLTNMFFYSSDTPDDFGFGHQPLLGDDPQTLPVTPQEAEWFEATHGRPVHVPGAWVSFDEWWNAAHIVRDAHGNLFTRRQVVLAVANKDGGSHVDRDIPRIYDLLSRQNSLGYSARWTEPGGHEFHWLTPGKVAGDILDGGNPAHGIVRQIAFETELSVVRQFPDLGESSAKSNL